ncbi:MAG TPA: CdaR family protein [Chloroflexota bacterium]
MAERTHGSSSRTTAPRVRSFGTAAVSARNAFAWVWSRESLLRLALSFVLSVALWLYITEKQDPGLAQDFPQPLPIETVNVGGKLAVKTNVTSVHVRYRADSPGVIVTSVNFHPIVSLLGMTAGPPRLVAVQVIPDPGLHVVQVSPASVVVTIDRIESRVVQVTPLLLNGPPNGFALGKIVLNPSTIRIQGPHTILSQITGASVPLNLSNVTATIDNSYKPVLRDGQGGSLKIAGQVQMDPTQVQVHVPISALSSLKSLPVLVPLSGQAKAGYRIVSLITNPQSITAQGSPTALSKTNSAITTPVHVTGRKATFTARVQIRLPKGLSSGTTSAFVTIGIQPIKTK